MTRRQLLRCLIGLKFLQSGDAHIWYLLIPRRKKSWLWKADEIGKLFASMAGEFLASDTFFIQTPLMRFLRSPTTEFDGGGFIRSPIRYGCHKSEWHV